MTSDRLGHTAQPADDLDELGRIEAHQDANDEADDDADDGASDHADDLSNMSPRTGLTMLSGASSSIVIEDDVPMPGESERPQNPTVYPWLRMAVGQSFFVPRKMKNPRATLVRAQQSTGFKFAHRVITENSVRGVRFWRVG